MSPKGLIIRHASTWLNEEGLWQGAEIDPPLSRLGRWQARQARQEIQEYYNRQSPRVFSSPLRRSYETAQRLFPHSRIEVDSRVKEIGGGSLSGLGYSTIAEQYPSFHDGWFNRNRLLQPPNGEVLETFRRRVDAALEYLELLKEDWLVVTHMGVLRAASLSRVDRGDIGTGGDFGNMTGIAATAGRWSAWDSRPEIAPTIKIAVGADHNGVKLLESIVQWLTEGGLQFSILGAETTCATVDYPDVAHAVAAQITNGEADAGILVCGTGVGMSIAANKVRGIRAACVSSPEIAARASSSNDAVILALGADVIEPGQVGPILEAWLETEFKGGDSSRKVLKIASLEPPYCGRC